MTSSAAALQSDANPQQLEAILATDGPVLIIAGPGSGKTFTLVERIVYLITQRDVAPESLFVVTFTDKAARELTTRISNRLADLGIKFNLNEMYLGTFHSICLRLLEDHREFTRLKRSFTLFDQFDQQYFLYQHIKHFRALPDAQLVMGDDQTGRWSQSESLLKWLNKVSEEALDVGTLAAAPEVEIRALAACFYESPLPGIGVSFSNLITDQAFYFQSVLEARSFDNIYQHFDELSDRFMQPDAWAILANLIYWVVLLLVAFAKAVSMAVIAFGLIASAVCALLGPLFVPFFIVPKLDWLFWGWFKAFIQYSFIPVVAIAFLMVFERFVFRYVTTLPPTITQAEYGIYGLQAVAVIITFCTGIVLVPSLTTSIFSGQGGQAAFPGLSRFMRR